MCIFPKAAACIRPGAISHGFGKGRRIAIALAGSGQRAGAFRLDKLTDITIAQGFDIRSEEHTSELQSLMRISYAVFCLKKKKTNKEKNSDTTRHTKITPSDK